MIRVGMFVLLLTMGLSISVGAQEGLDMKDPKVRKMIIDERKSMDCAGLYQQTKLKLDAQLKLGTKADATTGVSSQTVASMNEVTTSLGQSRRELCEFFKHDPEFTKQDYFRQVGELNKGESDASLLFKFASGKASQSDLKDLKTVKPQETSNGTIDVNATLKQVVQTVDSVTTRVTRAEQKLDALESETTQLRSKTDDLTPTHQAITTATATVEVSIATNEQINSHFMDQGGYLAFAKAQQPLMVVAATDCSGIPQGPGQVMFRGVFSLDATSPIIGKPMNILNTADFVQINFIPMKPNQHVLGGRAIVTINNAVRLEFAVPAQDTAGNAITIRDLSSGLQALK